MNKDQLKSAYIHIPFCKEKCHYCSFISYTKQENIFEDYINALIKEIKHELKSNNIKELETIYIGGGTPSVIPVNLYKKLIEELNKNITFATNYEFTIEVNPGTLDYEYLKELKSLGINRLSIGIQSFNDEILKSINRQHNGYEAIATVDNAKKAGFNNISIDLIYGLPNQTIINWELTLYKALELDIQHISTYGLKIEGGTYFDKHSPQNLPDEDRCSIMYEKAIELFNQKGFHHYEISNFAKTNLESKHNSTYWENSNYFGFGVAAHGYIENIRYSNTSDINSYINNPIHNKSCTTLSEQEIIEEAIFLGLRLKKGIKLKEFSKKYGLDLEKKYSLTINKYTDLNLLELNHGLLKFTQKGFMISNTVLADFLQ